MPRAAGGTVGETPGQGLMLAAPSTLQGSRAYRPGTAHTLARRILALRWVRAWRLDLAPSDFADCRTYAELIGWVYAAYAARSAKVRWGDKTPQYVREIPAEPERIMRAVCDFLGESFDPAMLRPMAPPIGGSRDRPASDGEIARMRWTFQERAQWVPRRLRVDGVFRLAPHVATLALVWAGVRRRVGLGR